METLDKKQMILEHNFRFEVTLRKCIYRQLTAWKVRSASELNRISNECSRLFLRDEGLKEFEFRNLKHLDFVGRFTLSLKHSFNKKDI